MREIPIFDTNVFGHLEQGSISKSDWRFLLRRRPGRGWRLSAVTALELLAGIHHVRPDRFDHLKKQIEFAWNLANGRVLQEPRVLICEEILHIPLPAGLVAPDANIFSRYLDVVRRAQSRQQIVDGKVPYGHFRRGGVHQTSVISDVVDGPKRDWVARCERTADELYPAWRELFEKTGRRLPPELRKEIELRSAHEERTKYGESFLRWLGANVSVESVYEITKKLDAVIEFTLFVGREFLIRNYSPEKHESDVYDQFQLHYLAMDRFVIVTGDSNLLNRTVHSSQADRIMSFDTFLQSL